jgi:hypothetical protein
MLESGSPKRQAAVLNSAPKLESDKCCQYMTLNVDEVKLKAYKYCEDVAVKTQEAFLSWLVSTTIPLGEYHER